MMRSTGFVDRHIPPQMSIVPVCKAWVYRGLTEYRWAACQHTMCALKECEVCGQRNKLCPVSPLARAEETLARQAPRHCNHLCNARISHHVGVLTHNPETWTRNRRLLRPVLLLLASWHPPLGRTALPPRFDSRWDTGLSGCPGLCRVISVYRMPCRCPEKGDQTDLWTVVVMGAN